MKQFGKQLQGAVPVSWKTRVLYLSAAFTAIALPCTYGFIHAAIVTERGPVIVPVKMIPKSIELDRMIQVSESMIAELVSEGLFEESGDGDQVRNRLAASADWTRSGRELRIQLRNARFSDGSPVTSHEAAQSLERCVRSSASGHSIALQHIQGYSEFVTGKSAHLRGLLKLSPDEIAIRTVKPAPLILDDLAQSSCFITKPSAQGKTDLLQGAIATGPYRIISRSHDEIVLKQNPFAQARSSGPSMVVLRSNQDFTDFQKMKQWATFIALERDPGETPGFQRLEYSQPGSHQLVFNNAKAPFNRVNVRKAVAMAIDFQGLAAALKWNPERLQAGMIPYGMRGFKKRPLRDRDLAEVDRLLQSEGYTAKHPLRFKITLSLSRESQQEAAAWPRLFAGTAIEPTVEVLPYSELAKKRELGQFDALRLIKYPASNNPLRLFASYLSRSLNNTPHSHLPKCDSLITRGLQNPALSNRDALLNQVEDCLLSNAILVPLGSIRSRFALVRHPWILSPKPTGELNPYALTEWKTAASTPEN